MLTLSDAHGHAMTSTQALEIAAGMSPTLSKVKPPLHASVQSQEIDSPSSFPWLQVLIEVVRKSAETEKSLNQRCKDFRKKHGEYERESAALKSSYDALCMEQTSLSSQFALLECETQEIKAKLVTCEENQQQHQELSKQYQGLKESSSQLGERLLKIEAEKVAVDERLSQSDRKIGELEKEVKALLDGIEASTKRIAGLENELGVAQREYQTSQLKLSESVKDLSSLRGNLASVQDELSDTKELLEQSQSSLDSRTRDNLFYQFIPSLDQKMWAYLITDKCKEIKSPVLLACYLVSALFRYAIYKLIYSQWLVQNQLIHAYQTYLTNESFKQTTLSIEEKIIKTFVCQSINAQRP